MDRKEQIEKARELLACGALSQEACDAIKRDFPELQESEDERKRKRVIECLKLSLKGAEDQNDAGCDRTRDIEAIKWGISYLEKQKEQQSVKIVRIPKFRVGDIVQHVPLEKWDSTRKITYIDEHGYQFDRSHLGDRVSGGGFGFGFEDEYELVEPKSAGWSEEDEEMLQRIIRYPESDYQDWCNDKYGHSEIVSDGKQCCRECIDWLKALPERLKHIRPQPQWKPTEEQMLELKRAIEEMEKIDSNTASTLALLKFDLQNL